MFSTAGWRAGPHYRISTFFPLLSSFQTLCFSVGVQRTDPMGLLYLNSYTVGLWPLSATARCLLIVSMQQPIGRVKNSSRAETAFPFFSANRQHRNHTSNIWKIPPKCDRRHKNGRWACTNEWGTDKAVCAEAEASWNSAVSQSCKNCSSRGL